MDPPSHRKKIKNEGIEGVQPLLHLQIGRASSFSPLFSRLSPFCASVAFVSLVPALPITVSLEVALVHTHACKFGYVTLRIGEIASSEGCSTPKSASSAPSSATNSKI